MDILINGAAGRMGKTLYDVICAGEKHKAVALADSREGYLKLDDIQTKAQCVIDFSNHLSTTELLSYCLRTKTPVVIATTGQTVEELEAIKEASKEIPVFISANMSLGIAFLGKCAALAASLFTDGDIEIIETHHNQKLDAPSGTALLLAQKIREARPDLEVKTGRSGYGKRSKNEICIHAVRLGNIVGEHEVIFNTGSESVTLKHQAYDRAVFANGAVKAAEFIFDKGNGLYSMNDIVEE